jgi:dGTPase
LEVAQIARSLASTLLGKEEGREKAAAAGGLDINVVESAALAHDLGHPPFGHVAEKQLSLLLEVNNVTNGYEGNAQSFRIVTKLESRFDRFEGLNLTRATLAATLKYPWERGKGPEDKLDKWGAYSTEVEILRWASELATQRGAMRTLEAAVMDWADDIAYAVHDTVDFFRAGLIPLDRLIIDEVERERFIEWEFQRQNRKRPGATNKEAMAAALVKILDASLIPGPYRGNRSDRSGLASFSSLLISKFINSVDIDGNKSGENALIIDGNKELDVSVLKGLTWCYVIESQGLASQRFGQRRVISDLFEILRRSAESKVDLAVFPGLFQEMLEECGTNQERLRVVADFIASMTEVQAIELHRRLIGSSLGSGIDHQPI